MHGFHSAQPAKKNPEWKNMLRRRFSDNYFVKIKNWHVWVCSIKRDDISFHHAMWIMFSADSKMAFQSHFQKKKKRQKLSTCCMIFVDGTLCCYSSASSDFSIIWMHSKWFKVTLRSSKYHRRYKILHKSFQTECAHS